MSFSALEGRYNETVYVDLTEVIDPDENLWTVAVIDMMRVGDVSDGLYMTAVLAPGRLIHRAALYWSLDEARSHSARLFDEILSGNFLPIWYDIRPLEPLAPSDDSPGAAGESPRGDSELPE